MCLIMNKLLTLLSSLVLCATLLAQQGNKITYEGVKYTVFPSSNMAQVTGLEDGTITEIVIADSVIYQAIKYPVTLICSNAFEATNITSVVIGINVSLIESRAFYNCPNLAKITIGDKVETIRSEAFAKCSSLQTINTPVSIRSFADDAFLECTSLPVTNNIHYADKFLVEAVDKSASTSNIKQGTRWIGANAWDKSNYRIQKFSLPSSIKSIGKYAFAYNILDESVVIPDSVLYIGDNAFCGGRYITATLGESVMELGENAFANSYLQKFEIKATTPPQIVRKYISDGGYYQNLLFDTTPDIYVPCGTLDDYKNSNWRYFTWAGVDKVQYRPYTIELDYNPIEGYVNQTGVPDECDPTTTIVAIPNSGYEFVRWSDGVTENPRTITLAGDISLSAFFRLLGEGIERVQIDKSIPCKIILEEHIYILQCNKIYTLTGQEVK